MTSNKYRDWKKDRNKDKLAYYQNPAFQRDYTNSEMDSKAAMFQRQCRNMVGEVLRQIWRKSPNCKRIWILSLGCEPGSDLLGVLRAVHSVLQTDPQVGWGFNELKCYCTGVDAFAWDRETFEQQVEELCRNGIYYEFHCNTMEDFVHDSSEPNGLIADRFDFICMSFADAGRNLKLVGTALPQMLSEFGRVLVLDNDIPTVRRPAEYGYKCTSCGRICLHSRGPGKKSRRARAPYRASPSSSVQIFREQVTIARLERGHNSGTQAQLLEAKRRLEELEHFDRVVQSATSVAEVQQLFQRHNLRNWE